MCVYIYMCVCVSRERREARRGEARREREREIPELELATFACTPAHCIGPKREARALGNVGVQKFGLLELLGGLGV